MKVTIDLPNNAVKELDELSVKNLTGSRGRCVEYLMIENKRLKNELITLNNLYSTLTQESQS